MLKQIDIFGLHLQTFGIFFALNFLAWAALVARRLREIGKPVDWSYEILFAALVGGLVGARVYFIVQNYSQVKGDLLGNIFSGSGLVWYGGLLGGVVFVLAWARWRDFLSMQLLDMAAVGLPLGYAIGRIGCQVSGDGDYGTASTVPWAMPYRHGEVLTPPGVRALPTPLFETVTMGVFALVLWRLRDHFRTGTLFGFYLIGAGIERFIIEFWRRNGSVVGFMTGAQVDSLIEIVLGIVFLVVMLRRYGSLRPAQEPVARASGGRTRPAAA